MSLYFEIGFSFLQEKMFKEKENYIEIFYDYIFLKINIILYI